MANLTKTAKNPWKTASAFMGGEPFSTGRASKKITICNCFCYCPRYLRTSTCSSSSRSILRIRVRAPMWLVI